MGYIWHAINSVFEREIRVFSICTRWFRFQDSRSSDYAKKKFHIHYQSHSIPSHITTSWSLATTNLLSVSIDLRFYMNGVINGLLCLISFTYHNVSMSHNIALSGLHPIWWSNNTLLYGYFAHLFIYWWTFGDFYLWTTMNNAVMNIYI